MGGACTWPHSAHGRGRPRTRRQQAPRAGSDGGLSLSWGVGTAPGRPKGAGRAASSAGLRQPCIHRGLHSLAGLDCALRLDRLSDLEEARNVGARCGRRGRGRQGRGAFSGRRADKPARPKQAAACGAWRLWEACARPSSGASGRPPERQGLPLSRRGLKQQRCTPTGVAPQQQQQLSCSSAHRRGRRRTRRWRSWQRRRCPPARHTAAARRGVEGTREAGLHGLRASGAFGQQARGQAAVARATTPTMIFCSRSLTSSRVHDRRSCTHTHGDERTTG